MVIARTYTMASIFSRLGKRDDPWQGLNRRGRSLDPARKKLAGMGAVK